MVCTAWHGADDRVRDEPAIESGSVRADVRAPHIDAQALTEADESGHPFRRAGGNGNAASAELSNRDDRGRRRRPGAEHANGRHPADARTEKRRGDAKDIGVKTLERPVAGVVVEQHRVCGAGQFDELVARVEQRKHVALEWHCQRQSPPLGSARSDEFWQLISRDLDRLVPPGQPESLIGGTVQDWRFGVRNRRTQYGQQARFALHPAKPGLALCQACHCFTAALCCASVVENTVSPVLPFTSTK